MEAFLQEYFFTTYIVYSRYLMMASIFFLVFYILLRKRISFKKIQLKFPKNKEYIREFGYSTISVFIMAGLTMPFFFEPFSDYSRLFSDFGQMPVWYHLLSFPLMMMMHDTYFYWMHRTMHHPKIFKHAHLVHHKSTNPSPWAAYSFHPIEAFFEGLIGPIIMLLLPVHMGVFGLFFIFQIVYNVYGHLGYELYPKGFNKHWFGKWINTSIHHNLHHKHFDNSYGLYFTFWDRLMGTMAKQYDETFDEVKSRTLVTAQ